MIKTAGEPAGIVLTPNHSGINAYSSSEYVVEAVVNKITGKSEFKSINPVDPFCGRWDTKF